MQSANSGRDNFVGYEVKTLHNNTICQATLIAGSAHTYIKNTKPVTSEIKWYLRAFFP